MPRPSPTDLRLFPCPVCGALNEASFSSCIRCQSALAAVTSPLGPLHRRLPGAPFYATRTLLIVTVAWFAMQTTHAVMLGVPALRAVLSGGPAVLGVGFGAIAPVLGEEPWRLLSAVFVHFGAIHLVLNMLGLWNLGRVVELGLGPSRLLLAYVITGVAGFVVSGLTAAASGTMYVTGGASGALLGLMGVLIGWLARRRDRRWRDFAFQAVFYGVVFGFAVNASGAGFMVNNAAHIGGLVSGVGLGALFASPRPRSELAVNVGAALAALACAASLLLARSSPAELPPPVPPQASPGAASLTPGRKPAPCRVGASRRSSRAPSTAAWS